jgi:hypothetical protein
VVSGWNSILDTPTGSDFAMIWLLTYYEWAFNTLGFLAI